MVRLNQVRRILKDYGLTVESTGRGKQPFKVREMVLGTQRQHTYPLRVHGKNPGISRSYLRGIVEEFNLPGDVFEKKR
jgi:hypothetical protein